MHAFDLKLDLAESRLLEAHGFDRGVSREGPYRLTVRSSFATGGYEFFLSGRFYSFASQPILEGWLNRFSPDAMGAWAQAADGDFTILVWDARRRAAYLVSDRNGAARAYYSYQRGRLCISRSRLRLAKLMDSPRLSAYAAYQLLTLGYVVDSHSLLQDSRVTCPGQLVAFRDGEDVAAGSYYSPVRLQVEYLQTESQCVSALDAAYRHAFQKRLATARTPCVLLSGGIDSLTMLKYIRQAYAGRITTVTFSFQGLLPNELRPARIAARYFGTDHHEVVIDPGEAAGLMARTVLADVQDGTYLTNPAVVDCLAKLGGTFDVFTGQDTRLHTPAFDLAREMGIRLHAQPASSRGLRALAGLTAQALRLWPIEGSLRHYLQHWSKTLQPRADLPHFVIEALTSFYLRTGNGSAGGVHFHRLLSELPAFAPEDDLQGVFKKYAGFEYRSQYTDDMSGLFSTLTSPATEAHCPFYDWEAVEASNAVPYHLGMRGICTFRSWSKMPFVRKRIARAVVRGSVPESLLYRAKKTCPHHALVFNHGLAGFAAQILDRWLLPLAESVDSEVRSVLHALARDFASRRTFDGYDEPLLRRIQFLCYLAVLNQACLDRSFEPANELRISEGSKSMAGAASGRGSTAAG